MSPSCRRVRHLAAGIAAAFQCVGGAGRTHVIGALAFTAALELGGANCAAAANTFIVNTDQDPGPMGSQSLRQAITLANGSAGNTVQFDANLLGSTITLGGNEIDITQPMSITGPGSGKLTISGNEASRIFLVTASTGTVAFSGLTLAHGHTTGQLAGAGIAAFGTAVTLNDCIVTGNTSRNGAGIFAQDSDVTISNSRVSGNASTYVGGGIVAKCASPHCGTNLAISHSTISGNTAGQSGGGIYTYLIDGISLEQSLISGNRTTSPGGQVGGGIFIYQVQTPRIVNSTISGNYSFGGGGGIYADFAYILFSTIAGNSTHAADSNGILPRAAGQVEIDDSILANNFSSTSTIDVTGSLTANFSIVRNAGTTILSGGSSLIGADPQLGPLADRGGATWAMLPAAGSPAVNAGESVPPSAVDQRGLLRPVGAKADMGAVERQTIEDVVFRDGFNFFP